ncbi:MAG: AbrB/MazE/SpoVT family DNA-binding domain-containing protein [Gemmatimonadaceae bacterium]
MPQGPKSPRLVARFSVRVRREGGSLSMTIPRYIARHWKLEPGVRLVVRSTDKGILLYPRYFLPYAPDARLVADVGPDADQTRLV